MQQLSDQSRVWIYQSNRPFTEAEEHRLQQQLNSFAQSWVSHNRQLMAAAGIHYQRFIVLMVDETMAGASGCSIDASVHFLKNIEQEYGVQLFDRMNFAFWKGEQVEVLPQEKFAEQYRSGTISGETRVFDNLVKTKAEFEQAWIKPLSESWHSRLV